MRSSTLGWSLAVVVGSALLGTREAQAQGKPEAKVALELRGGANVPTFDIGDAARTGPSFGAGLSYKVADRVWLIGDADFGFHNGARLAGGGSLPDVDVYHYVGKVGYEVLNQGDGRFSLLLNAGAGAMTFKIDGGDSFTYPAINVGAKLIYGLGRGASFVLSPQGDIAFSDKAEVGTNNSWVWPFAAGLRFTF